MSRTSLTQFMLQAQKQASAAKRQAMAAGRGAWDGATMGLGDRAVAATLAIADKARGDTRSLAAINQQRFAQQKAQDAYDSKHFAAARRVGQVGGVVASLAIPGGGVAKGVTLLAKQAGGRALPALVRAAAGRGVIAAEGGALSSVAGQAVADGATGHRSDARDYAAAAVGGALGGFTTRALGAGVGGAVEGMTTTAVGDIFHGEAPDFDNMLAAAQAGSLAGKAAGKLGRVKSASLPPVAKGELGEKLSKYKSLLRLDPATGEQVPLEVGGGRRTIVDTTTRRRPYIEAKFDEGAKASNNQLEAADLESYYIDHFRPEHVGQILGTAASGVASKLPENLDFLGLGERRERRPPNDWFPVIGLSSEAHDPMIA